MSSVAGCVYCGHSLATQHNLTRDRNTPGHPYHWGSCRVLGCPCTRGRDANDTEEEVEAALVREAFAPANRPRAWFGRRWSEANIVWGETACERPHCGKLAECIADGIPVCIDCADDYCERIIATELNPELAATMRPWDE